MRKLFLLTSLVVLVGLVPQARAQLFLEDFNYAAGDSLALLGYNVHSGGNTNGIKVASLGLSYTGYPSSGIGNSASLVNTGQDVNKSFNGSANAGSVYAAFMVSVDSASTGDYFFHLIQAPLSSFLYAPRVFVRKANNGNLAFGINKGSGAAAYSDSVYAKNTTYLIVAKYTFVPGAANDQVSLYVFTDPNLPTTEPGTPSAGPVTAGTDATSLDFIALRQGSASSAPFLKIDGISIGTSWESAVLQEPASSFSTKTLAFGNVRTGRTLTDTVFVQNVGGGYLNISGVTSSDPRFTLVPLTGSILPGATLGFAVTFAPVATVHYASTIIFASNTAAGFDTVLASGDGVTTAFQVVPSSVGFGTVIVDSSKLETVTVTNLSHSTQLTIDSVKSDNPVFTVSPTSGSLDTAASANFAITFLPTATGPQSGNIVFFHNAFSLHDTVKVSGTGVLKEPVFTVTPGVLNFVNIAMGQSKTLNLLVKNTGFDSLKISSVTSTDPQFVVAPTSAGLDTNASRSFAVTYTPSSSVPAVGYIHFLHNGLVPDDSVRVTGTGALAIMTIAEARQDTNHDGMPDRLNDTVAVVGVVNSVNIQAHNSFFAYYIQDTTGGLELFAFYGGPPALKRGDRVRAVGVVSFYNGTTEIMPANPAQDVVVLDTGNALVPIQLTIAQFKANGEKYEGRVIKLPVVQPLNFTSANWPPHGTAADLNVWDGTDTLTLRIEGDTQVPGSTFPNFPVMLTGVAEQFTSVAPYNTGYQIAPMDTASFVHINTPPQPKWTLVLPADSSTVSLDDTGQVISFAWLPDVDFNGDTLTYHFVPLGHPAILSDNGGRATFASIKAPTFLPYLGVRDSIYLQWTANASDGVNPTVTNTNRHTVLIKRGTIQSVNDKIGIPVTFALDQNFPNPFNPTTTIQYALPKQSRVSLKIYSVLGQEVATLVDEVQSASYYRMIWNGKDRNGAQVATGIYFYRIQADPVERDGAPFVQVKKMLLVK